MFNSNIEIFKQVLADGLRANRFLVSFHDPISTSDMSFFVKSTTIPDKTLGMVEVAWMGQKIKLAGDPTFNDWSCTFVCDTNLTARKVIEAWYSLACETITNTRGTQLTYKHKITVEILNGVNETVKKVALIGAFPTSLGELAVAHDSNDQVMEFTVNFAYDYFVEESI
jgi:hypothetical protein